jgi:PAS domain S-box-containing protein
MSPTVITGPRGEDELRFLPSATRVAAASALVALLIAIALVTAWRHVGLAPALLFASAVGSSGLAVAVMFYSARLRQAEALYRMIVQTSQVGIVIVDERGTFTFANHRFAQMLGYTPDQLLGRSFVDFVRPADRPEVDRRFAARRNGDRFGQNESCLLRRDGTEVHVLTNTTTLFERGRMSGVLAMIADITPRKEAEAARREEEVRHALQQALANAGVGIGSEQTATGELATRLADVTQELQTFTYSVSHDLRAPLRAIDGFARELQLDPDSQLSEYGFKSVERIRAASWRMTAMIDGLLNLSRASSTTLQRRRVDLSAIAQAVAGELTAANPDRAITFEIADELRATGDPHLLRIVFDNLLGNAVKFTGRNETAHITVGVCDDGTTFFVRDDGAGFDERHAAMLFQPFQRLHPPAEFDGSGIGLATVARIVQRHGGSIRAAGSPGRGATFFFNLGSNVSGERA